MGIGRVGGMAGPLLGGMALAGHWNALPSFLTGALPMLLVAALLIAAAALTSWYERSIELEARVLADEIAASVVPDEALVPSAVKGARAENAALAASIAGRLAPRQDPVVALRVIEAAAKAAGVKTNFTHVDVAGWDGDADTLATPDFTENSKTPYAAVVATLEGTGTWAQVLTLAASLESLPLAARVDAVRLGSSLDAAGRAAWSLTAQVSVIAK
jgi:hypothetical protein